MTIRIGYFPNNNSLFVLRHSGLLDSHLSDVEWVDLRELPAPPRADPRTGLPTLHSDWLFDNGGYDFIGTGFTPPITGLGQGRDLVYVGISGPRIENGRLVSTTGSGIRTVADLRGRRVGIAHGSWQTTLALLALDREGLRWADIVPVDIDVNDGGAALLRGDIDAWVGAYPALAEVESSAEIQTLVDTDGLFSHPSLWFVRREFAENHRPELEAIVAALQESDAWIIANPREAARFFVDDAERHGGTADLDRWEAALRGRPFGIGSVTPEFLDEQQRCADLLYANGLLPRTVDVRAAVVPWIGEVVDAPRTAPAV
ncbi:ABC transporter substrate-binding protein [Nocardia sp. NPDC003345]